MNKKDEGVRMINDKADEITAVLNKEYSHMFDERKKFEVRTLDDDKNILGIIRNDVKPGGARYRIADIDFERKIVSVYYEHYFDVLKDLAENHIGMNNLQKCWEEGEP